jgi:hypothetical protein
MEFWIREVHSVLPERTSHIIDILSLFVCIIIVINAKVG